MCRGGGGVGLCLIMIEDVQQVSIACQAAHGGGKNANEGKRSGWR